MGEEMHDRLNAAEALVKEGKYDEATAEFVWLWKNMDVVDPGMEGVRVSFMAKYIKELVGKHPPARLRFAEIRDLTAMVAGADVASTKRQRFDWIVLNEILSEPERTLGWYESVKTDPRHAEVLDKVANRLIPLLRKEGRFRDIGLLYRDPIARLARVHRTYQPPPHIAANPYPQPVPGLPPEAQQLIRQMLQTFLDEMPSHVVEEAAFMVKCLLAADRAEEAEAVDREARRLDPSEAMREALDKARGRLD